MSVEHAHPSYEVPKWAGFLSWTIPVVCCMALVWARQSPWTKGTIPGLVLTYAFGWMWIRMAVRLTRREPIPNFVKKPVVGMPEPTGWLDSPVGTLLQVTLLLAAGMGLAIV